MSGWIGVDLDGTLAAYGGWKRPEHIGAPIPAMVDRVKRWLAQGREVRIFTARVDGGTVALSMGNEDGEQCRNVEIVRGHIEAWCLEHIGSVLPVTNVKDYGMVELWDDRAVHVKANAGEPCCGGSATARRECRCGDHSNGCTVTCVPCGEAINAYVSAVALCDGKGTPCPDCSSSTTPTPEPSEGACGCGQTGAHAPSRECHSLAPEPPEGAGVVLRDAASALLYIADHNCRRDDHLTSDACNASLRTYARDIGRDLSRLAPTPPPPNVPELALLEWEIGELATEIADSVIEVLNDCEGDADQAGERAEDEVRAILARHMGGEKGVE